LTPLSAIAAPLPEVELPFMPWVVRRSPALPPPSQAQRVRSYGIFTRLVQGLLLVPAIWGLSTLPPSLAQERPLRLVALGDSLTTGLGLPAQSALPAKLSAALQAKGIAAAIADAGVSGDTAANGLARLDWAVPDETDGVIVALGANDMLRGIDPAVTRKALDGILRRLGERRIPALLAGMRAAPNLGTDFGQRFNTIYPELAAKHGVLLYPFLLDGVAANATLNQRDGIHPTAAGVDRMVAGIVPKVEELIASIRQRRPP
jgi:acyl-CoA thioesterase-1